MAEKFGYLCTTMNKLLIDIGNTAIKIAIAARDELLLVQHCENLTEEIIVPIIQQYQPKIAILSSVRKAAHCEEMELLARYIKKNIFFTYKTPIPIRNLYATPETLGVDRLATAVGANTLFPKQNCMIIDCGTAITIDFLSDNGQFLGGNISPGLRARFKALHHYTGRLPLGNINENAVSIGQNTQEAIEAGVLQGAVNEIEGYIEQYPNNKAIITGGDTFYFATKIKKPIFVVLNLNFIGLAKIVDYNAYI